MLSGNDDSLGGKNLYAYCFNNPVMFTDETGDWPSWGGKLLAIVAVATVVVAATVITVATCGIGSVAGIAAVSTTATIAFKTAEVFHLQKEKSKSEDKSTDEVKEDVANAICNNVAKIFGLTPITKTASTLVIHNMNKTVESIVDHKHTFKATLKSKGGTTISFIFLTLEIYNVVKSFQTDNPEERANERGYRLQ